MTHSASPVSHSASSVSHSASPVQPNVSSPLPIIEDACSQHISIKALTFICQNLLNNISLVTY